MPHASTASSPPHPASAPLGLPAPRRYWAIAVQLTGIVIAVLDSSIINVALPTIADALGVTPASAVRIANLYNITLLVMLLPLAALGERVGFRRIFGVGLAIFALASLACALSRSLEMLAAARVLQGIGAAAMMAMMGGLVRHIHSPERFGRGIGLNAMTVAASGALGPTVSSAILSVADWPWLFAINVPIALLALAGLRCLPDSPRRPARFDWWGALHNGAVLTLFVLGIERLLAAPALAAVMLTAAVALGYLMVRRASRQEAPLVPVDLFRLPRFSYAVAASAFSFGAQMGAFVALPFYFHVVFGLDQIAVGFLMTTWPICGGIMAPIAGRLADRYSAAVLSGIGACAMTAGLAVLATLPPGSSHAWIVFGLALGGVGFGFFQSPNNRAMLTAVPVNRTGAAGGVQATTRTLGQGVGIALVGICLGFGGTFGATAAVILTAILSACAAVVNVVRLRARRAAQRRHDALNAPAPAGQTKETTDER